MKLNLSRRAKKYIIWIVVIYLLFDLRPILLIPNAVLYFTSKNTCCVEGVKCYQARISPRLNVGGDSVMAIFSEKNISSNTIKSDDIFGRSGDRSGAFWEFQLSGKVDLNTDIETLYLLLHGGIGGGLGGDPVELDPDAKVQKTISVNNYIRISKAGLYRVSFSYGESNSGQPYKEHNLKNFFILQFPENYVSKTLQSVIFTYASLIIPNENVKEWCVQHLGYQDSWLSTYFLIKYLPYYSGNAKRWANTGIIRNKNIPMVSRLINFWERKNKDDYNELRHIYLWAHTSHLLENNIKENIAKERLAFLMDHFYERLNDKHKENWKSTWSKSRERQTDENYLKVLKNIDQRIVDATTQEQKDNLAEHKKWMLDEYNNKEKRDRKIRLIDFMLAKIGEI